MSLKKIMIY